MRLALKAKADQETQDVWAEDETFLSADEDRERLQLQLDGFEGPIDVLLALARDKKIDLVQISILELVEQYLVFVRRAQRVNLELAADYLVMAAWLAYLKSRLLIPEPKGEDEPSGAEMAAELAFQLRRLQAMREAGAKLLDRAQLGTHFFVRGEPQEIEVVKNSEFECNLYDLLQAYGRQQRRSEQVAMPFERAEIFTYEAALEKLRSFSSKIPSWTVLSDFMPKDLRGAMQQKSAKASFFVASLEMVRVGQLDLRQDELFGPIFVRDRQSKAEAE